MVERSAGGRRLLPVPTGEDRGTIFYRTNDGVTGYELWKSDGTKDGTVLVKDIDPGPVGSNPWALEGAAGLLFFSASDGVSGDELWMSHGTAAGTVRV